MADSESKPSRAQASKFAVLGMLTLKPMSGYEMRAVIQQSIGNFWSESFGQIYPTLKALEKEGAIRQLPGGTRSKRERNVYDITQRGRDELHRWLASPPYAPPKRNELLLKVFFGPAADLTKIREHVQTAHDHEAANLARYKQIEKELRSQCANEPGLPFWLMTLHFGVAQAQAVVRWSEETLKTLDSMTQPKSARAAAKRK